jgi:hypothetical protein
VAKWFQFFFFPQLGPGADELSGPDQPAEGVARRAANSRIFEGTMLHLSELRTPKNTQERLKQTHS